MADLNPIIIGNKQVIVTPIVDYFAKKKSEGLDLNVKEHDEFNVGIVEKVGEDLPAEWKGHIIYYHRDVALKVRIKGIADYHMIRDDQKILVRLDQSRNNY